MRAAPRAIIEVPSLDSLMLEQLGSAVTGSDLPDLDDLFNDGSHGSVKIFLENHPRTYSSARCH